MKISSNRAMNGFTLVEVMFAAALMLVGIVGMIEAITIGSRMLDTARKQTIAQQIIQTEIDGWRMRDWSLVIAVPTSPSLSLALDSAGSIVAGSSPQYFAVTNFSATTSDDDASLLAAAKGFTCTCKRSQIKPTLQCLTFTITWTVTLRNNVTKTYTRSGDTYIAKNGLNASFQQS